MAMVSEVLILSKNKANLRLLENEIQQKHDIDLIEYRDGDDVRLTQLDFDLCVLDRETLRQRESELRRKKESESPTFLPYLLLLGRDSGISAATQAVSDPFHDSDPDTDTDSESTETGTGTGMDLIDDVVSMPVDKIELNYRVENLLRNRELSVELRHRKEMSDRRFKSLFENAPDPVAVVSQDGEIIDTNEAFCDAFGIDDAVGSKVTELSFEPEEEVDRVFLDVEEDSTRSTTVEYTSPKERLISELNTSVISDLAEPVERIGIFRDITAQKKYEKELQRKNTELELLNRIVRHDIRNDMTVALGWLSGLEDRVDDPDARKYVEKAESACENVVDLTEVARDFVRSIASDEEMKVEPVDISDVLREEYETKLSQTDAEIKMGDIPSVEVRANDLIDSVFRNILNNSIEHNDSEEPRIEITAEEDNGSVIIRIADNGPGVPDETKDEIFGRGEKGLESEGTGVGLYLVDTVVENYGGEVWVDDSDMGGAVFNVKLPVC
ncbi:MAG: PAS domain-containing sensor histidine kinase [Halobacteria archaeon]|nr:PAS domain-containing sensor histidine kinase [Halobacteria archaeon]